MPDFGTLNATSSASSGFAITDAVSGVPSWFSVVASVGIATVLILLLTIALSSFQRYKKIKGFLGWLFSTFNYFLMGVATLGVLSVPTYLFYYFISQARDGNTVPLWITFAIIGGYFAIAGIGYIFKKWVFDKIYEYEKKLPKKKVPKMKAVGY
jgi:hypothetical protein